MLVRDTDSLPVIVLCPRFHPRGCPITAVDVPMAPTIDRYRRNRHLSRLAAHSHCSYPSASIEFLAADDQPALPIAIRARLKPPPLF